MSEKVACPHFSAERFWLAGVPLDNLTLAETLTRIDQIIAEKRITQHCVLNAGKFVLLEKDPKLRAIIAGCGLVNADGQAVVWAGRLLGYPLKERVAGIDLMEALIKRAAESGYRVFFLGARMEIVKKVVALYRQHYPRLVIGGYHHGYFRPGEEEELLITQIRESRADILFVAFSSPKKEYWLADNLSRLGVIFAMGVGGSFDVVSGICRRAPRWLQRIGLEWFYRFLQEPRRMWRRYLVGNFLFIRLVIREFFRKKCSPDNQKEIR